jgi:hypothetical protein
VGTIIIDPEAKLAAGKERLVFQHPEHADRIIKVAQPRYAAMQARRRFVPPFSDTWRYGALKRAACEVAYYLECQCRHPEALRLLPAIHGFTETSIGFGLVCEKIDDGAGGLAPTLDAAVRAAQPDQGLRERFDAFVDAVETSEVVFRDVRPKNVVVAPDRLVIVDGFGDIRPLLMRGLSGRLARRRLRRDLQRLRQRLWL